jgi:hypothetical protein
VDASAMSFWLRESGIHIVKGRLGPVLVVPV